MSSLMVPLLLPVEGLPLAVTRSPSTSLHDPVELSLGLIGYDPSYRVIFCRTCQYALVPNTIAAHLASERHLDDVTRQQRTHHVRFAALKGPMSAELVQKTQIAPDTSPIPYLALYSDGIACTLCEGDNPYVCRARTTMRQHLKTAHSWRGCAKPGRPTKASLARGDSVFIGQATREPVYCQTFHKGNFVRYFEVAPPGSQPRGASRA
ncbi:hypothetical protein O988_00360 [Pseudogymnoascus sp. VKM F-3808]|nr:hypothetical protein O988_00360 [Pseudogymnoascus sp. VKM F-3808]